MINSFKLSPIKNKNPTITIQVPNNWTKGDIKNSILTSSNKSVKNLSKIVKQLDNDIQQLSKGKKCSELILTILNEKLDDLFLDWEESIRKHKILQTELN
jgi:hypothetical protein